MLQSFSNNGLVAKYVAPHIKKGLERGTTTRRKAGAAFEQSLGHCCRNMFSGAGLQPCYRHCLPDNQPIDNDPRLPHVCADPAMPRAPGATFSPHSTAENRSSSRLSVKTQRSEWNPNCWEAWSSRLRDPVEKKCLPNLYHILNLLFSSF